MRSSSSSVVAVVFVVVVDVLECEPRLVSVANNSPASVAFHGQKVYRVFSREC